MVRNWDSFSKQPGENKYLLSDSPEELHPTIHGERVWKHFLSLPSLQMKPHHKHEHEFTGDLAPEGLAKPHLDSRLTDA